MLKHERASAYGSSISVYTGPESEPELRTKPRKGRPSRANTAQRAAPPIPDGRFLALGRDLGQAGRDDGAVVRLVGLHDLLTNAIKYSRLGGEIRAFRVRQMRSVMMSLLVSQGVSMILSRAEVARTQGDLNRRRRRGGTEVADAIALGRAMAIFKHRPVEVDPASVTHGETGALNQQA